LQSAETHHKAGIIKMMKPNGTLANNQEESAVKDHLKDVFNEMRSLNYDDISFDEIDEFMRHRNLEIYIIQHAIKR
jgi:hypothetical protein